MPCGTQVVTPAPLPEAVVRTLITNNYCVEDCNYLLDYYRPRRQPPALYGGGVVYGYGAIGRCRASGDAKATENLPTAGRCQIDYRWTGNFLLTLSRMPPVWSSG